MSFLIFTAPFAKTATYHVDPVTGNDFADGLSPLSAWRTLAKVNASLLSPGDQLLFKASGTWFGQLKPQGSGSSGNPVTIDKYGDGAPPIIDGNGFAGPAVYLYNVQYYEVQNLEITNNATSDSINRSGIRVYTDTATQVNHIWLRNLHIHDVRGSNDFNTGKTSGGIQINSNPSWYDDVLVENCSVHDVKRVGITVNTGSFTLNPDQSYNVSNFGTNVRIRGNTIYRTGGDGMINRISRAALIEYNVCHDFPTGGSASSYCVGMWTIRSRNDVFQYNEVYNSATTIDGQAYDADLQADGTIFQYNYSHDNAGGFMLFMNTSSNTIVRYNISRNDRGSIFNFSLGVCSGTRIYNNIFFIPSGAVAIINRNSGDNASNKTFFNNNIIYNFGIGGYISLGGLVADYNCYYGNHPASEPAEAHKNISNPQLTGPGAMSTLGIGSLSGFKLLPTSPCINAGTPIAANGGLDFWGNVFQDSRPDIGPHEFPAMSMITSFQIVDNVAQLDFRSTVNRTYAVDYSEDLIEWSQLTGGLTGTGFELSVTDPSSGSRSKRFYRVRSETP